MTTATTILIVTTIVTITTVTMKMKPIAIRTLLLRRPRAGGEATPCTRKTTPHGRKHNPQRKHSPQRKRKTRPAATPLFAPACAPTSGPGLQLRLRASTSAGAHVGKPASTAPSPSSPPRRRLAVSPLFRRQRRRSRSAPILQRPLPQRWTPAG